MFLSTTTTTSHSTFSWRRLCRYTCSWVRHRPILLWQFPDWRSEEHDRQVANVHLTLQHESSPIRTSWTGNSLISGEVSYTGWTLSTWFGSKSVFRCLGVCTTWLLNTCPVSTLCQPVFDVPGRLHLRSADRGQLDSCQTGYIRVRRMCICLRRPNKLHGTHFLSTSETIVSLCQLSNATLRPFSSLFQHTQRAWFFFYKKRVI